MIIIKNITEEFLYSRFNFFFFSILLIFLIYSIFWRKYSYKILNIYLIILLILIYNNFETLYKHKARNEPNIKIPIYILISLYIVILIDYKLDLFYISKKIYKISELIILYFDYTVNFYSLLYIYIIMNMFLFLIFLFPFYIWPKIDKYLGTFWVVVFCCTSLFLVLNSIRIFIIFFLFFLFFLFIYSGIEYYIGNSQSSLSKWLVTSREQDDYIDYYFKTNFFIFNNILNIINLLFILAWISMYWNPKLFSEIYMILLDDYYFLYKDICQWVLLEIFIIKRTIKLYIFLFK